MQISSETYGLVSREAAPGAIAGPADTLFSGAEHCVDGMKPSACRANLYPFHPD